MEDWYGVEKCPNCMNPSLVVFELPWDCRDCGYLIKREIEKEKKHAKEIDWSRIGIEKAGDGDVEKEGG